MDGSGDRLVPEGRRQVSEHGIRQGGPVPDFQAPRVTAEKSNSPVKDRAQVEAGLDFVNQNPEDQRANEIKTDMQSIEEARWKKLYNTGAFYEKSGKPDSARVYYREVVKNPNSTWAAKAQERLAVLDNQAAESVEKKAGMFGPNPLKKDKVEMRTSEDEVVPCPRAPATPSTPATPATPAAPTAPPAAGGGVPRLPAREPSLRVPSGISFLRQVRRRGKGPLLRACLFANPA